LTAAYRVIKICKRKIFVSEALFFRWWHAARAFWMPASCLSQAIGVASRTLGV